MHITSLCKSAFLVLLIAILTFTSRPISAEVAVSTANRELITPYELQQIVKLAMSEGKSAEIGEFLVMNYLEFQEGDLRQYVSVEAAPGNSGTYDATAVNLTQETWTKPKPTQDLIDQWIISIEYETTAIVHRQVLEAEGRVLDITSLPVGSSEARGIARGIVKRFVE